jgi:hypothetical protein
MNHLSSLNRRFFGDFPLQSISLQNKQSKILYFDLHFIMRTIARNELAEAQSLRHSTQQKTEEMKKQKEILRIFP